VLDNNPKGKFSVFHANSQAKRNVDVAIFIEKGKLFDPHLPQ
jgi:hypothetical protein